MKSIDSVLQSFTRCCFVWHAFLTIGNTGRLYITPLNTAPQFTMPWQLILQRTFFTIKVTHSSTSVFVFVNLA